MKKSGWMLLAVALLFVVPAVYANDPGGCAQTGTGTLGPQQPWDYSANGLPYSDSCWGRSNSPSNIYFVSAYDSCNFYRNFYEWRSTGTEYLWQTFTVAYGDTVQHFYLQYILDFVDPYADFNDTWRADVYDLTTNTWLGGDFTRGSYGSQSCAIHRVYCSSGTSLQGHQIQIRFTATRNNGDPSLRINVKYISLTGA